MKNNIKKIIVAVFSLVLLFIAGQNAFAATNSVTWNTASNDCSTIAIANKTQNIGFGNPCWVGENISANSGDTIRVRVYYHNTGTSTANNTKIKITKSPSGNNSTNYTFSGQIISDSGTHHSINPSGVYLTIPAGKTLDYVTAYWYPDQTSTGNGSAFLYGQNGSEVLGSGLRIGNIEPGWDSQGTVIAEFKVNSTQTQNCTVNSFGANYTNITPGQPSTLSWETDNCTSASISPSVGNVNVNGTHVVHPTQTTTYTLTATGSNGVSDTSTVRINVTAVNNTCVINNFIATPSAINQGDSSNLAWYTSDCANVKLYNGNNLIGTYYGMSGNQSVFPTQTTTYTLKGYSSNGANTSTKTATVTVNQIPQNCTINSFTANPTSITVGQSSTLAWNTSNCNYVTISNLNYNVPLSGQQDVWPTSTTTYVLTAYSSNGQTQTRTATVTVNQIIQNCTINSFTASPTTINNGGSSTLSWNTTGCTSATISDSLRSHNVSLSGSESVHPTVTTTYKLTARGSNGVIKTKSVTVTVNQITQTCTINNFTANPTSINPGESSTLVWNTSNCISAFISPSVGTIPVNGTKVVYPNQTTTYTLTATGSNGVVRTRSVIVSVITVSPVCVINSFTANPTIITQGQSSTLVWDTTNCTHVSISNLNYNVPLSGQQDVWPTSTTTYKLTASGPNGGTQTRSVTVTVKPVSQVCTINSFTASPTTINSGASSTLAWSTNGCESVALNGSEVPPYGNQTVWPTSTTTYTLTATNSYGITQTQSVTVYVNNNNNNCRIIDFSASDTSIDEGDSTILRWETDDCERVKITDLGNVPNDGDERVYPDSDTTYILTAYDFDGSTITDTVRINVDEDNNNNDDECRINSFTADRTYINRGDEVELRWRTTDCDDVSISNFGDVDEDGSETFSPNNTTTYTLRARGDNGSDSETVRITVGGGNDNFYNTNVVTTIATNITQTSAQVNGLITSTNYGNATTYFEYGTNVNLGLRTASRPTGGNSYFNEYLSNLSPNTIYYFRAVGEGSNGISRGSIEVFRTLGYTTTYTNTNTNTRIIRETVVEQGNTVYGSLSPIMLRIENRYQTIGVGDVIDYTVYYKNISISRLTNPMVQVYVPKGIIITNSSRGTFSNESRTLSVPIADLNPNDEGVIYLQAVVEELDANLAQIVTTAVLIYTNPNGAQENAMAYALNNPKVLNVNNLGASAFFGNILGLSLIGWLLLIILIMLLILLSRSYYGRRNVTTTTDRSTH